MDERQERTRTIYERLARAHQETCRKRHITGSCEMVTFGSADGEAAYFVPRFEWSIPHDHADAQYQHLIACIAEYIDGRREIDSLKPVWTGYCETVLENPVFALPQQRHVIGPVDQDKPLEERRHRLLFSKRDSFGDEIVCFYEPRPVDALDLMRWVCGGYTHIKEHGEGEWRRISMPMHEEIENARLIRGEESKARKRMSALNADDERASVKQKATVVVEGQVTLEKLRAIRDAEEAALRAKGKKIKRPKGRAVRPKKAPTTKRKVKK